MPPIPPGKDCVVFAGPDYDLKPGDRLAHARQLIPPEAEVHGNAVRGLSLDTRGLRWNPLPGAAAEAEDVRTALRSGKYGTVKTYVGPDALEEVFKTMPPPRLLHIATHGFFLPDPKGEATHQDSDGPDRGSGGATGLARLRKLQDPLLRSGIVLAGANAAMDDPMATTVEDGWVTAGEIALVNLRGTELVVLSACETGLGDVRRGEGVYGLRHAFLYAGARSLITSLFEVPDTETRELMKRFYELLDSGRGKLNSLHEAQLDQIAKRRKAHGAAHPFFWASFVLVGDPD